MGCAEQGMREGREGHCVPCSRECGTGTRSATYPSPQTHSGSADLIIGKADHQRLAST